jgi:itaconate CoA-transferase
MTVALLFGEHGTPPRRMGLTHYSVAPYGVFHARDGSPVLISVQNDREWAIFCERVLERRDLIADPRFATNPGRIANRAETDGLIAQSFAMQDVDALCDRLDAAQIAFARVNEVRDVLGHPHLRRVTVGSPNGPIDLPAAPARLVGEGEPEFGPLPALGEHTEKVRREFLGG